MANDYTKCIKCKHPMVLKKTGYEEGRPTLDAHVYACPTCGITVKLDKLE